VRPTHCAVCGRKLVVMHELVGYMAHRYYVACLNGQCDECYVEVAEVGHADFEPTDAQMGAR
jgi:hypothetical protein